MLRSKMSLIVYTELRCVWLACWLGWKARLDDQGKAAKSDCNTRQQLSWYIFQLKLSGGRQSGVKGEPLSCE
jgi:hypothetical protein